MLAKHISRPRLRSSTTLLQKAKPHVRDSSMKKTQQDAKKWWTSLLHTQASAQDLFGGSFRMVFGSALARGCAARPSDQEAFSLSLDLLGCDRKRTCLNRACLSRGFQHPLDTDEM